MDAEWSSAAAPSAAIEVASCADAAVPGIFIALQNLLNSTMPPAIVSISYGQSEPEIGAAGNAFINSLYQQGAAEGVSIFVSAGDQGAASSDAATGATHGIAVSGFASTPYNVAVGGTDFADNALGITGPALWSEINSSNYGSALHYVPEIPWNDSCASVVLADHYEVFDQSPIRADLWFQWLLQRLIGRAIFPEYRCRRRRSERLRDGRASYCRNRRWNLLRISKAGVAVLCRQSG